MLNRLRYAKLAIASLGTTLVLGGCRFGGQVTTNGLASSDPTAIVAIPTIANPATTPYYSSASTLNITGVCMTGYTVILSGDSVGQVTCANSQYSFTVSKSVDAIYSFYITQTNSGGASSIPLTFNWIRKTSVAPPVINQPPTKTFQSGQAALTISGNCDTGSTVSLAGDGAGSVVCANSAFALTVPKASDGTYNIQVNQTDQAGNVAGTTITWQKHALAVSPSAPILVVNTSQALTISGGSGQYSIAIASNASGGSFNAVSGTYTAGTLANVADLLVVSDTLGSSTNVVVSTVAGAPDHLSLPANSGISQTQNAGTVLANPLIVQVVDRYGNGIPAIPLVFKVTSGDSMIVGNGLQTTDAQGNAQVSLRLGFSAAINTVFVAPQTGTLPDAAASGTPTISLTETATTTGKGNIGATFLVGTNPGSVAVADFDKDGYPDIAILNAGEPTIGFLRGKGNGLFANMSRINGICAGPSMIIAADFNGDGFPDLAVACGGSDRIQIFIGNGDGTFKIPLVISTLPNETAPVAIASADLNGDGKADLVAVSVSGQIIGVYYGKGDGTFNTPLEYAVGVTPVAVAIGDLNKDGKPDIVVANADSTANSLSVLMNNGNGTFAAQVTYNVGTSPSSLAIADFDGDGWNDVVVLNAADQNIGLLLNDKTGGLQAMNTYPVGNAPTSLGVSDIDGDGKPDVLVSNSGDNTVSVLYGQGNGTFNTPPAISVLSNPVYLIAADVNGDGRPDLIVSGNGNQSVQVIPSQTGAVLGYQTSVDNNPVAMATADFDGDGKPDVAILNSASNTVNLLKGNGKGLFTLTGTLASGVLPTSIRTADLNHDGKMDLIITSETSNLVRVYLGNGDGTFQAANDYGVGTAPMDVIVGDFNGDGYLDLAVANQNSNTVSVLLGKGDGTFNAKVDYHVGQAPDALAVGDMNGDHKLDLVVVNNSSSTVGILIGNGDGTFQAEVEYPTGNGPNSVAVGDFNRDGTMDVAVVNALDSTVSILIGNGDGSLKVHADYSCGNSPNRIAIADFNSDGRMDLVVGNGVADSFTILYGNGTGQFNTSTSYPTTFTVNGVGIADFNNDGAVDVMVFDGTLNTVQLWLGH